MILLCEKNSDRTIGVILAQAGIQQKNRAKHDYIDATRSEQTGFLPARE
jgi:hypothetical protein